MARKHKKRHSYKGYKRRSRRGMRGLGAHSSASFADKFVEFGKVAASALFGMWLGNRLVKSVVKGGMGQTDTIASLVNVGIGMGVYGWANHISGSERKVGQNIVEAFGVGFATVGAVDLLTSIGAFDPMGEGGTAGIGAVQYSEYSKPLPSYNAMTTAAPLNGYMQMYDTAAPLNAAPVGNSYEDAMVYGGQYAPSATM